MNSTDLVLHISCTHSPDDDRILYRECLSLKKAYSLIIIGVSGTAKRETLQDILTIGVKDGGYKANIRAIMNEARKFKPAMVHVHDLFILKEALRYAHDLEIPLIYDVHEHFPLLVKCYLPGSWVKKQIHRTTLAFREKHLSRKASHIITVVPQLTSRFSCWNKQVTEIRNYPRRELFENRQTGGGETALKIRDLARNRIVLIYAGDISRHRNLFLFADTVAALNKRGYSCVGVTLGKGEKSDVENWVDCCRNSRGQMLHLGQIPHQDIPSCLQEAHIGWSVLPDISPFNISLPNKIFEYLACGLPFVSSDLYNIRHLFWKNPAALIFQDEKAEGIATLIQSSFPDRELLNDMKKAARETFLNRFTWELEESKLHDIYRSILKDGKG